MTIRTRVLGAFALVLVILLALGANAYLANGKVDREARRVWASVDSNSAHIEFLVQLRSTLARAKLFAASEDATDRESLETAIAALDDASAKLQASGAGELKLGKLRSQEQDCKRGLNGVIALIATRQLHANDLIEALTAIQVFASAIAERTGDDRSRAPAALAFFEGVEGSGISALRYRASRDPSDIEAAIRWSAMAHAALDRLTAAGVGGDDRLGKLLTGVAAPLKKLDAARLGVEAATASLAASTPAWDATAQTVLATGVRARVGDAAALKGAADTMLASVRSAGAFDLVATLAAIVASAILALHLVHSIVRPLAAMTGAMHRLAGGALETAVPYAQRRDEVGAMAKAMVVFRDGLLAVAALNAERTPSGSGDEHGWRPWRLSIGASKPSSAVLRRRSPMPRRK